MRAVELREVLRGREFRRLYATRLASQLTDGIFQVALAGNLFFSPERQTSAGKAAAAFAVLLLPYSVVGPFAGVFIDRWSRREILIWAPVIRAALVAVVASLLAIGHEDALFFLAALLVLGVNRFFLSALSAALPHVVRRDRLVLANSLAVTSGTVIAFVGAGVGYLLRRVFGAGPGGTALILLAAAAAYLLAALIATTFPRGAHGKGPLGPNLEEAPPHTREALANVLRGLADGARHIWRHRPAALALTAISFHRFLYGLTLIMTLLLYRNYFATDAEEGLGGFAIVIAASGAGYFLAALITPPVVRRISKEAWICLQLGISAVALTVLGLPFADAPWVAGSFVLGVVSQGVKLCVDTIVQETVDDAYRGRVFAVYDMLFNVTFAAAAAAAVGWMPTSGKSYMALVCIIVAYAVGGLAYYYLARTSRTTAAGGATSATGAEPSEPSERSRG